MGLLGNAVLLAGHGARAVGAVTVAVLIWVTSRNSLAPFGATFEVDVLSVCTCIDDVDIDPLSAIFSIEILVEGAEAE